MRRNAMVALGLAVAVALAWTPAHGALVARYNFDDSTATDQSPANNNDGIVGSNIFFTADTPLAGGLAAGTASNPGGGDSTRVINVPNSLSLAAIDDQLSVAFWMKATTATNNNWVRIFQHGTEASGQRTWLIDRYSNTARTNMRVDTVGAGGQFNQNIATGGPDTFDGSWHHLFYVIDNGTFDKYVDGLPVHTGTYNHGDGVQNTRPLYLFGRNNDGEYVGLLDDIALWDDAKGPSWAATIAGLAGFLGTSLDDDGIDDVAILSTLGSVAWAGGTAWRYTDTFPAAKDGTPLTAGMHYIGVDDRMYILFSGSAASGFLGVENVPEPGTVALLGLGVLGLARRRRRRAVSRETRGAIARS